MTFPLTEQSKSSKEREFFSSFYLCIFQLMSNDHLKICFYTKDSFHLIKLYKCKIDGKIFTWDFFPYYIVEWQSQWAIYLMQNPFVLIFKVVRRVCIQKRIDTQTNLKLPYIQQEKQNSIIWISNDILSSSNSILWFFYHIITFLSYFYTYPGCKNLQIPTYMP